MPWFYLAVAIGSEIAGTLQLRSLADGVRWLPLVIVVVAYLVSFGFMILTLRTINVGVSYAIWSAVGTAAVAVLGAIFFHEKLNALAIVGLVIIVIGVVVLTASGSTSHG
jgi:small multidrug resistance pump